MVFASSSASATRPRPYDKYLCLGLLGFFVSGQLYQGYVYAQHPELPEVWANLRASIAPHHQVRALWLLLSFFGLLFVSAFIYSTQRPKQPLLATIFLATFTLFCSVEILYRSVEYFTFMRNWIPAALRHPGHDATLLGHVQAFNDVVQGLYFPLISFQLMGSMALLGTTGPPTDRYLRFALLINSARLLARLLSGYGGIGFLSAASGSLYLPLTLLVYAGYMLHVATIQSASAAAAPVAETAEAAQNIPA